MMRAQLALVAALGVAACSPQVPESGVGFTDYNSYMQSQTAAPAAPVAVTPTYTPVDAFSPAGAAAAIDRAQGVAPVAPVQPVLPPVVVASATPALPGDSAGRPRGNAPVGIQETTSEMDALRGISDEQDFDAVAARETIESDKARIERNKATYTVDQPTAVPTRNGDTGPNIVQFALSTNHEPGVVMYRRSSLSLINQERACAKYASPDLAQEDFLASGGPERDRKGLDADGDGYACLWDPRPFRTALN